MATAIGDLVVNIGAQTGQAQKGIGSVSKLLKGLGPAGMIAGTAIGTASRAANALGAVFSRLYAGAKRVGVAITRAFLVVPKMIWRGVRAVTRFAAVVAGIGTIGGLAGFGVLIQGQMAAIDTTAKLSDRIGITTEKLAGLRHAAELTGTGSGKLDAALQVMQKRLGEVAIKGSGAAAPALEALGLRARELIGLAPDVAFGKIADAMAGLGTQSEKNAVTANIFSRANQALVNTLALTSGGLDVAQREAERLGIAFSRLDAAKVEAANDAITRMKTAIKGVTGTAAIALAPMIERYADSITKKVPAIVAVIRRVGTIATSVWNHVATGFQNAWQYIVDALAPFQDSFRSAFETVVSNLDVMLGSWEGFRGGVIHLTTQAALAFETIWEHVKHQFVNIQNYMVSFASQAWDVFSTWLRGGVLAQMVRDFRATGQNMAEKLFGPTLGLVPKVLAKLNLIADAGKGKAAEAAASAAALAAEKSLEGLKKTMANLTKRAAWESRAAREAEDKRHKGAVGDIKTRAAAETAAWAERLGELPKLSDAFREAIEGSISDFTPTGMPAFAGAPGGGGREVRYAGAMERGSYEARMAMFNANKASRGVAKDHLKEAKRQTDILSDIAAGANSEETVSIPST